MHADCDEEEAGEDVKLGHALMFPPKHQLLGTQDTQTDAPVTLT
jgi:hypothetical protein